MASRNQSSSPPPRQAKLTVEQMRRGIERIGRRIADLEAFDPAKMRERFDPQASALSTSIEETLASVFGHGTIEYHRYLSARNLDGGPMVFSGRPESPYEIQQYYTEGKQNSIGMLRQAVRGLQEEIADSSPTLNTSTSSSPLSKNKVFIVHGREEGPREAIARFLERLNFQPIILHEQANQGRTVIEKVEAHSDVGFAVIILTPDDMGNLKGEAAQPRARQNVLLELGYFIGKLTRKRVCTFKVGELEIPSDWRGVVDEPYDAGGAWKQTLARELEAAEYEIDWNKIMRS